MRRTLQEGPKVCCGLAVSPGKPWVPHCEERPGAAHSRKDQIVLWVNVKPRKSSTVNGTVLLKPFFKGQVGCVRAFV